MVVVPALDLGVRGEARRAMEILGVQALLFEEIPAARVSDQPLYQLILGDLDEVFSGGGGHQAVGGSVKEPHTEPEVRGPGLQ